MLTVTTFYSNDVLILECRGRIVRGDETSILCAAARQDVRNVVVDLKEVETIDAAGVGALVSLQAAGIYLKLANPNAQVRELLKVTKLDSIFEICDWHSSSNESKTHATGIASSPAEKCHAAAH
jgi:anti-anti-sigma factor